MKFCKDCRWFGTDEECWHISAQKIDPVYGKRSYYRASVHRGGSGNDNNCGEEALHFQPKVEDK